MITQKPSLPTKNFTNTTKTFIFIRQATHNSAPILLYISPNFSFGNTSEEDNLIFLTNPINIVKRKYKNSAFFSIV